LDPWGSLVVVLQMRYTGVNSSTRLALIIGERCNVQCANEIAPAVPDALRQTRETLSTHERFASITNVAGRFQQL
jgi:hypothetical protein